MSQAITGRPLGSQLPFILDVSTETFDKLDQLLKTMCDVVNGTPNQEQECMAIAILDLLKLQV